MNGVRAAEVPAQTARRLTAPFALACAVFFLSGLASLMDEVVWFKYLNLTLGSTTAATATLLAVLMGGLALGSWLFGRHRGGFRARRRRSPPAGREEEELLDGQEIGRRFPRRSRRSPDLGQTG